MSRAVSKVIGAVKNFVKDVVKAVVDTVVEIVHFVKNVIVGIVNTVVDMVKAVVTGDFKGFLDSLGTLIMTAVAVTGIVMGGFLAIMGVPIGYALLAAGIVVLDTLYNEGKLTMTAIELFGDVEHALLGTEFIRENAVIIESAIVALSYIFVSVVAGSAVFEYLGFTELPTYLKNSLSAYNIYTDFEAAVNLKEYYSDLIKEAQEALEKAQQEYKTIKQEWFNDITSYEINFEINAGGVLYNAGGGSDYYDFTAAQDPMARLLGMPSYNDANLNKMVMMREYNYLAGGENFNPLI